MANDELRTLPSVDEALRVVSDLTDFDPVVARWIARREIEAARERVLAGGHAGDVVEAVGRAARALSTRRVRRVINATGVILHTNLGRAPLSERARRAAGEAMGAAAIEFDVEAGARAERAPSASTLAAALCDAQDALVVNNNAGALLLILSALATGRDVIVSRGELIEIGGSFRLPDVMASSGAALREVGTTNKTRAQDYASAVGERTALILKVHPSNYEVVGFAGTPSVAELKPVADAAGVPIAFDIGSGLIAPRDGVMRDEPDARSALAAGADLVCFSGDKLLGGPQAGIIAGSADLVTACRRHPIARAVRADKLSLAALEATLDAYARGDASEVPVWSMLDAPLTELEERARRVAAAVDAETVPATSAPGGGSLPGKELPTILVRIRSDRPHELAANLRANDPPIIVRIDSDGIAIDPRSVDPSDDALLIAALRS